jgi:hypothetical protein
MNDHIVWVKPLPTERRLVLMRAIGEYLETKDEDIMKGVAYALFDLSLHSIHGPLINKRFENQETRAREITDLFSGNPNTVQFVNSLGVVLHQILGGARRDFLDSNFQVDPSIKLSTQSLKLMN